MRRSWEALHAFTLHLDDAQTHCLYLGLALTVSAIILSWRDRKRRGIVLALVLSILGTISGIWLIGVDWESRYFMLVPVALAILGPIGLEGLVKGTPFSKTLILGTMVIGAMTVIQLRQSIGNIGHLRIAPMECFDRSVTTRDVHRCVANYWLAKPIAMLASKPISVIQVDADGKPYWWINTRRYNSDGVDVDCAVFPDAEAGQFVSKFGEPESSIECDGNRVMTYNGESRRRLNKRLQPLLHVHLHR